MVSLHHSIAETTTGIGGLLQPTMNSIPRDSLYPGYRGLAHSVDAERSDLIEGRAPVLETMVRGAGVRAESLTASATSKPSPPAGLNPVEAISDEGAGWAFEMLALETHDCS